MDYRTYLTGGNTKEEAIEYLKTCEKPINYFLEIGDYLTTSINLTNEEAAELVANDPQIIKVVEYNECVDIVKAYTIVGNYRTELKERGLIIL